ncbi:FAD-dependent oxidoreductase [Geminicoccus roseus]|uniref:FAD-dependent oxidoreductase n=1 Tax=Geminicoccus roseus TaxID=404900 RepID=UPI0003F7B0FB|nr:bifunctional TVP38/TMEM64 family protein/FAD-dependent oxidoreductase [Geminicoccus roseus]
MNSGTVSSRFLWASLLVLVVGAAIFVFADGARLFDIGSIAQHRDRYVDWISANPLLGAGAFFLAYVAVTAVSIPGAAAMTVLAGSLFGLVTGTILVSFASVAGATLAMLAARYLLRGFVERRFGNAMAKLNRGVERDGASYLFGLRLVPVIPFVAINLGMGLTRMNPLTFAWVSQLGMLPATLVYVNAGSQLMSVERASDLLSARLLLAFLALAIFPFAAKRGVAWWQRRGAEATWQRPARFDYNLVVIGAGSAGLVSAYVAAAAKARVALIEQNQMGGDCLNTGCVPSKALIRSAKLAKEARQPERLGLDGDLSVNFPAVMARIRRVIARIEPHDSAERYRGLGVEVISGRATIVDPWTVRVDGRSLSTRKIVVATGAEPSLPPIPGLEAVEPLTSESLWSLTEQPVHLLVVGGGAIGCELAQSFARLGSKVVMVEAAPRILGQEDDDVAAAMVATLEQDGVEILAGAGIARFEQTGLGGRAHMEDGRAIEFTRVLVATGRRPRVTGFGLEELGLLDDGKLVVDERLQTRLPSIHAAGDVIGQLQFTHAASHHAWHAAVNSLFGRIWSFNVDVSVFPIVIYTDPEMARVGITEAEARARNIPVEVTRFDLADLDRAITDGADDGFIKVLTVPGKDRILGATVVGARAGDLLAEFTLAMRHGLGLKAILKTIHPYPGWMEANKAVAGAWQRDHVPDWAMSLSERWMRWQRG